VKIVLKAMSKPLYEAAKRVMSRFITMSREQQKKEEKG